jgi:hypothetical protein
MSHAAARRTVRRPSRVARFAKLLVLPVALAAAGAMAVRG